MKAESMDDYPLIRETDNNLIANLTFNEIVLLVTVLLVIHENILGIRDLVLS